jgi:hypothetical protein
MSNYMRLWNLCVMASACLLFAAGCAGKGGMGHVRVETTSFAAEKGLTIKDWRWSGGKLSVQFSVTSSFSGTWNLFAQAFDTKGTAIGNEIRFLNSNMAPGRTEWIDVPDVKLTEQTGRVAFDIQSATKIRREPHY